MKFDSEDGGILSKSMGPRQARFGMPAVRMRRDGDQGWDGAWSQRASAFTGLPRIAYLYSMHANGEIY